MTQQTREQFQERIGQTCFAKVERWANNTIAQETWDALGSWNRAAYFNAAEAVAGYVLSELLDYIIDRDQPDDAGVYPDPESFINAFAAERGISLEATDAR